MAMQALDTPVFGPANYRHDAFRSFLADRYRR
jgi:hypothetical protein